jgi:hypothetical protein
MEAPKEMEAPIKAGHMEELRFGKRQQWAVAAYTIGLIAGAFHLADGAKPLACWEKAVVSNIVLLVAAGGIWLMFDLQKHLASTRTTIDPDDKRPWWRGMPIAFGLAIAQFMSAIAVIWALLR